MLKKIRRGGWCSLIVIGFVLLVLASLTYQILRWTGVVVERVPPSAEVQNRMNSYVGEYLSIKPVQAKDLTTPYLTGKIVVVDRNAKKIDGINWQEKLDSLRANDPKEVGTIIWLDCHDELYGTYESGAKGYQAICDVTVIDKVKNMIVGQQTIAGPLPPQKKYGTADVRESPQDNLMDWIVTLKRL